MSRQHAAAAVVFIALAVAFTWPLTPNLGRAVAEPGDAYWNIWILDWDWWGTLHQPLRLYHANMLHPAKYSLATSENLYGVALLLVPLRAIGVGPVAAYNFALLLGFAFAGFAAYVLAQRLTGSFAAGLAAGIFFAFVRLHLTHMQHVWSGWLPLLLLMLLVYADRPTPRRAALFAAVFVMNGLTNVHYFFFGAFAIFVTALFLVPRSAWRNLAIATGIALVILAPFYYPYAAVAKLYGLQRTYAESYHFSALPSDWLRNDAAEPERHIAPGVFALLVAASAYFVAYRQWQKLALATLWIAVGFFGSLGMHFEFHRFLFGAVPGFRALRVPARWSVIAYLGMAILIALATAAIDAWCGARLRRALGGGRAWRRAPHLVALVGPAAFAIALWRAPIRWYLFDPRPPEVYQWLARGTTPIAELPIGDYSEYSYYLRATAHHRPVANGMVGTPMRRELGDLWAATPITDGFIDALARDGVDLIIVHADLLGARSPAVREWLQRELDRGRLFFVRDFTGGVEGDWVFRVAAGSQPAGKDRRAESPPLHLQRFLLGAPTCSASLFGALESPLPGSYAGRLTVGGWAISPHGIAAADVYFNNRRIRYRLPLTRGPSKRCWSYPANAEARYGLAFTKRPEGVWRETDVQVDVTDSRGNVWTSDNWWFRWE